ncbi:MAG TPA: hypothetical protein VGB37_16375 [Candidatus Lokiarchaeia archaeon]
MFIAYILKKTRFLKIKIVIGEKTSFRYHGFDYDVDQESIYLKKFLGIKIFRWAMYFEEVRNPIHFDFLTKSIQIKQVPLNYIARLMNALKLMKMEIIIIILIVIVLITELVLYQQISSL